MNKMMQYNDKCDSMRVLRIVAAAERLAVAGIAEEVEIVAAVGNVVAVETEVVVDIVLVVVA